MKLFLVRHGETEENVAGILMGHHHGILTEKGKTQAKETATNLKNYDFTHIYSSDLDRCVDTAEFIKEFHPNTPLTFTKELRELNMGVLQGQNKQSIGFDSIYTDSEGKPEGGESFSELKNRAVNFIKELYQQHSNGNILLITHNGWIKQAISHFTQTSSKDIPKIENAQIIEIEVEDDLTGRVFPYKQSHEN